MPARGLELHPEAHEGVEVQCIGMGPVKDEMIRLIEEQPDDSTFEEILRELAFSRMVDRGLADSEEGRVVSHDELGRQMRSWRK